MFSRDNPEVDIVGSNLYDKYIIRSRRRSYQFLQEEGHIDSAILEKEIALAKCRAVPKEAEFEMQTVKKIDGILVGTGVFDANKASSPKEEDTYRGHRDFEANYYSQLRMPTVYVDNILEAIKYVSTDQRSKYSLTS